MVTEREHYYFGEDIKMTLTLLNTEEHPNIDLNSVDFVVQLWTKPSKVKTITREELTLKKDGGYVIIFNSEEVGIGKLNYMVTLQIPDADMADGIRTQKIVVHTGKEIRRDI